METNVQASKEQERKALKQISVIDDSIDDSYINQI